jgi:drug/metabolite transporter (DMT)-like permease
VKESFYTALRLCGLIVLTRLLVGVVFLGYHSVFGERIFEEPFTKVTSVLILLVYPFSFLILAWLIFFRKRRKPGGFPVVSLIALLVSAGGRDAYTFGQNLGLVIFFVAFFSLIIAVTRFFTRRTSKEPPQPAAPAS